MIQAKSNRSPLMIIFLTVFINLLGVGIVIPIVAPLLNWTTFNPEFNMLEGVSKDTRVIILGFLIASFSIAQFFGAPILGALSDRYGRKKFLALSIFGTFVGYLLFAYAIVIHDIYLLFFSRILDGFTGGNISIAFSAISDLSDEKTKAKNFGMVGAAFGLGFILGPYLGGKLSDPAVVSWFTASTPFWFAAVLTALNLLFVFVAFPETLKEVNHTPVSLFTGVKNINAAFKLKHLRTIFLVVFLLTLGWNFFTLFFSVFLIDKFNYSQQQIGMLFAFIGIWIVVAQGGIQRPLTKKYSSLSIIKISAILIGITLPLLLYPSSTQASYLFYILPFLSVFQGITQPNVTVVVSNQVGTTEQGQILGINQSIQSLAMAIPPIIAGYIHTLHPNLPIMVASACTIVAWIILIAFFKNKRINKI